LLEYTLPPCPNIAGVVFELLNYYATKVGRDVGFTSGAIAERCRGGLDRGKRISAASFPARKAARQVSGSSPRPPSYQRSSGGLS
jgi:hypothetical protein